MANQSGRKDGARTALERQRLSRKRNANAYTRARNAAEREVVHTMVRGHNSTYELIRRQVEEEISAAHRATRQSRIRSGCAAWYRRTHTKEWDAILDKHIAAITAGTSVVIRRRKVS